MRINKFLADCGVASRRSSDKLISDGAVKINGQVATLGDDVDVEKDTVTVNGKKIRTQKEVYYIMNKPKGYITTVSDDKGRRTVMDLIKNEKNRIYPVGRLDYDTEGMLILTNDGELAYRLTHPKMEITKTYVAKIEGKLNESEINRLKQGVEIEKGVVVNASNLKLLEADGDFTRCQLTISEGRNRQIRRMFEAINKNVIFLKRTHIGNFKMTGVNRGEYRKLTKEEIESLKNM